MKEEAKSIIEVVAYRAEIPAPKNCYARTFHHAIRFTASLQTGIMSDKHTLSISNGWNDGPR